MRFRFLKSFLTALLLVAGYQQAILAQSPAVCIISGTVLDGGAQPIVGTPVRFRTIAPTTGTGVAFATQDLTVLTGAGGTWSLTLVQGLNAQVDIPAAGIQKDTVIPSGVSCPAAFTSLTLYNRGTLTPATILSTSGPSMGGDLTGSSPNPTVVGLRGQPLAAGACTNGQARVYSSGSSAFTCQTVAGNAVSSITAGTGISVTGTATVPIVGITNAGVTPTQLASGAAATNVGSLSGDLSGTLPAPAVAAGAITDSKVNAGAAIAWSKINKTGATAADVGAVAAGTAVTSVTAGTGMSMSGTATAPIVNIANGGVGSGQLAAGAAATNVGALGGDFTGSLPNPSIAAGVIVDADVNAAANIAWTKVSKAGAAESDIPGLVADLADKLSKGAGGTVAGNVTFNGTSTFNGTIIASSFAPNGELRVIKTADATSGSQQKVSFNLVLEGSVWNSTVAEKRLFTLRNTPTGLNAGKLSLLGYAGDNVVGSEIAYIDAVTGQYNGPTAGTHTGPVVGAVTGNVTGNVSGTAATFTGSLTGDVTSSAMATTVQSVGGSTAANVHNAELIANAATALNTAGAVVKRDGSNNFAAGTITANLTGNVTGALTGNATTASDGLTSASGTAPLTLSLAAKALTGSVADASAGAKGVVQLTNDLGGTATAPSVANVGGQTAANVAAGAVLANAATASPTISTIVKRDASGNFSANVITAALTGNATTATNVTMGGDATGNSSAATVTRIQGNPVLAGTPTDGQIYQYVAANGRFEAKTFTGTGTVTSVAASGGTTGFSFTGTPITNSGTLTLTGTLAIANGGTGQTTAAAAFNALWPGTTLGDLVYGGASGAGTRLAGNTTTVPMFLRSTGSAGLATAPVLAQINASTDFTGTTPVVNGGTGAATLTGLLRGNGTSAITGSAAASLTTEVSGVLPVANGGTNKASWTTGSVPYASAGTTISEDNANFFWDGTNHRLGLGTPSPARQLDISSTAPSFQMTDTTASAKSLRVTTDANIASFYEAAGAVGDILSLDLTNKRTGLGTAAPTAQFHLLSTAGGNTALFDYAGVNQNYMQVSNGGGWLRMGVEQNTGAGFFSNGVANAGVIGSNTNKLQLGAGGLAWVTIAPSVGGVGIGTSADAISPETDLVVSTVADRQVGIEAKNTSTGASAIATLQAFASVGNAVVQAYGGSHITKANVVEIGSNSATAGTRFISDVSEMSFWTNNTKRVVINYADGNVGLGVAAPAEKLEVLGNEKLWTANAAAWIQGSASELLTLNTAGTTTDTSANLLPANSVIRSVVVRVTTSITVASAFSVGDATIAARFLATGTGLTSGSTGVGLAHVDQTGTSGPRQTSAAKVRVTTTGTPSAGQVRITVFYDQFIAPTS